VLEYVVLHNNQEIKESRLTITHDNLLINEDTKKAVFKLRVFAAVPQFEFRKVFLRTEPHAFFLGFLVAVHLPFATVLGFKLRDRADHIEQ